MLAFKKLRSVKCPGGNQLSRLTQFFDFYWIPILDGCGDILND